MNRILLADEEHETASALVTELTHNGYSVIRAQDGEQALRIAQEERPNLVVLDIALPGLDGLTLCRILRAELNAPIFILTSRRLGAEITAAFESGADDCLVKPLAPGELSTRLQAFLRRKGQVPVPKLQAGDLLLDLSARRAFRRERILDLSRKEFDLLAEFLLHPGTVLGREVLLSRVWGERPKTRTLDSHIYRLREKIEENPSQPKRIRTIRGLGYRFDG